MSRLQIQAAALMAFLAVAVSADSFTERSQRQGRELVQTALDAMRAENLDDLTLTLVYEGVLSPSVADQGGDEGELAVKGGAGFSVLLTEAAASATRKTEQRKLPHLLLQEALARGATLRAVGKAEQDGRLILGSHSDSILKPQDMELFLESTTDAAGGGQ